MRQQFLMGDVLAHLDVQEELEIGLCGHRVEQLGHPLGLLVVGGHPARTKPYGAGSLSNMLTFTFGWVNSSSAAYMAAGPEPTMATFSAPVPRTGGA